MSIPKPIPFTAEGPEPLLRETPAGAAFPVDALGPLSDAVTAAQAASQAPVAIAAQTALAAASLGVQCHANVETLSGNAPVSLYALTIAKSGERKSTTEKLLMAGVRDYERQANRAFEADYAAHKNEAELWRADHDLAVNQRKKKGADRTAIQADLEALGPEPEPPLKPFLTSTEPTLEGLHKLYAVGQPGLGVFSDEGGGFLGGHGMSKENRLRTLAGLSDLWGGEPIKRVRAGDGASTLYGRRLAMHLLVQPVAAEELLADPMAQGQGFLARFLLAHPPSAIGTRLARPESNTPALDLFAARMTEVLNTPKPIADGTRQELEPRILPLSKTAKDLLWEYYLATEKEQAPGGSLENCTGFASKSPEQACRIAGVLTLWQDLNAPEVSGAIMANAIILAQYYLSEAKRLADGAIVSMETTEAEKLRLWLLNTWPVIATRLGREGGSILPRDILQYGPGSLREKKKVVACIRQLVEARWLASLPTGTLINGSNRREAYQIVRASHVV